MLKTKVYDFSWFGLKTGGYVFSRFGLKTGGYGSCDLSSKPLARVSLFEPQNRQLRFGDLTHKITMMVSWFGPQNQVGYGLLVAPQNRREAWRGWCTWHHCGCHMEMKLKMNGSMQ
jgi:hypothetical protein